jgi:hypothetical protein
VIELAVGGVGLLDGEIDVEIHARGAVHEKRLQLPPGAPQRPPSPEEMRHKAADCLAGTSLVATDITWPAAAQLLRTVLDPPLA